jgi:hypothetical protein
MSRIAGWITKIPTDRDFYCTTVDHDPFDYSYGQGVSERDTVRRKADIAFEMRNVEEIPEIVFNRAMASRRPRI